MQKITPFLWFDSEAEEAARFYTSIFRNSAIGRRSYYDAASAQAAGRPEGSIMTIAFTVDGQDFVALNGGPGFRFNESISFVVNCDSQEELDRLWERLTEDGTPVQCGWLKDKYGISWQIVPSDLPDLVSGPEPDRAQRAMAELMTMQKIDVARLRLAYHQGAHPR